MGQGFMLQMDGNLHGGPELIKGDPNVQNSNGKLFMQFLDRNKYLTVAKNLDFCQGVIIRMRILKNKTEKAILDFLIINEKLRPFLSKMMIDEDRNFCLSNFSQFQKNKRVIETDHNTTIAELNISVPKRKPERIEMFNLRNKRCQDLFTLETENNTDLIECFQNEMPFDTQ